MVGFANEDSSWTSCVVRKYLLLNGNVDDNMKKELVDLLFCDEENDCKNSFLVSFDAGNSQQKKVVKLKSLKHIEGVNSLMDNQTIGFSDDVTFIYGLNGTGKSSYYRILYNMSNADNKKNIYNDIYSEDHKKEFNANIKYLLDNSETQFDWNNTDCDESLKVVRFFDTTLSNKMLQKRNSDELLLKPFYLNLFSEVIGLIDELKIMALKKVDTIKSQMPQIDLTNITGKYSVLNDDMCVSDIKDDLLLILSRNLDVLSKECSEKEKQKKHLLQENSQSTIEFNKTIVRAYSKIKTVACDVDKYYREYYNETKKQVTIKEELKNKKAQIQQLGSIVNSDNDDWKRFIKYGLDYQNNYPNRCPFCHREYDDNALDIIKAYEEYLKNDIERKYNDSRELGDTLKNNILLGLNSINEENLTNFDDELKKKILEWKESISSSISSSANMDIPSSNSFTTMIDQNVEILNQQIEELEFNENTRTEKVLELEKEIVELKQSISLINQKDKIEKLIVEKDNVKQISDRIEAISTQKLSRLSKQTHEMLLTETLKETFSRKLHDILGSVDIDIELNVQNSKGVNQMELSLKGKNILDILSEGEQKAVALTLFLTEVELSQNKNPIIFDDPVNSMDNKIAGNFAKSLLKIDNQIVIFSHNLLFLDSFRTSKNGHICKTYETICNKNRGRHIFVYEVRSYGKNKKGVITKYLLDTPEECLKRIDKYLNEKDFNKEAECSILLRQTVELAIDAFIFKNQVPSRFSSNDSRFNWEELKKVGAKGVDVDELRHIHDRCSGGEMHIGIERTYNPLTKEEIENMKNQLLEVLNKNKIGEGDE